MTRKKDLVTTIKQLAETRDPEYRSIAKPNSARTLSKYWGREEFCAALQLEYVILNRQPHVTIRLGQAPHSLRLVYLGLQHHQRNRNATSRALDGLHRGLSIEINPQPGAACTMALPMTAVQATPPIVDAILESQ